jgi:hypothetical protein
MTERIHMLLLNPPSETGGVPRIGYPAVVVCQQGFEVLVIDGKAFPSEPCCWRGSGKRIDPSQGGRMVRPIQTRICERAQSSPMLHPDLNALLRPSHDRLNS